MLRKMKMRALNENAIIGMAHQFQSTEQTKIKIKKKKISFTCNTFDGDPK